MRYTCSALALLGALSFTSVALAEEATPHATPHWTYDGKTGPAFWGELAHEYSSCATGRSQSPINLEPAMATHLDMKEFTVGYKTADVSVANNGHTIQASLAKDSGNTLTLRGDTYNLLQFHFHTPSEHMLTGENFPMEMHLVNADANGGLAVVGLFIKEGAENRQLEAIFSNLPAAPDAASVKAGIDLSSVLPESRAAMVYSGSLTTPPCTEQVNWIVMEQPVEMSKGQIAAFQKLFDDNHRPVQALNDREIDEE